jgi:hypothetical protein
MKRLLVTTSLTLDGVMQAPGRPEEDVRGGFDGGGWALPYNDAVLGGVMGEGMAKTGALVLGRRTYEDFAAVWPHQLYNPFTEVLNNTENLRWLRAGQGDPAGAVAAYQLAIDSGDADMMPLAAFNLGLLREGQGDHAAAAAAYQLAIDSGHADLGPGVAAQGTGRPGWRGRGLSAGDRLRAHRGSRAGQRAAGPPVEDPPLLWNS